MGWVLRHDTSLHWVRFHSLPASKRYADTDEEMEIILDRGNQLGNEVLGRMSDCWIVHARRDCETKAGAFSGDWEEEPGVDDAAIWRFFVKKRRWIAGKFDKELEELADDAPFYTTWFNPKSGKVFAPYDGGFDLFVSSAREVTRLKRRYRSWLSDLESGL